MGLPLRADSSAALASGQANPVPAVRAHEVNDVHPFLQLLRAAIDESGWKHAALASVLGVKPPYLSMLLSGEKPWTAKYQAALPDDIERRFAAAYAELFGLIVVVPVEGEQAIKQLVAGLFGVLGTTLPTRASRMAKARMEPGR